MLFTEFLLTIAHEANAFLNQGSKNFVFLLPKIKYHEFYLVACNIIY